MTKPVSWKKNDRLIVTGITGDWAFAAGSLLLALVRHNPRLAADVLVYHDTTLSFADKKLLEALGARCETFAVACEGLRPEAVQQFSLLSLSKLACFRLLEHYESVLWLDADVLVQDSLDDVFSFGPLAMALQDAEFGDTGKTAPARVNVHAPIPCLDGEVPNMNSGVLVLRRGLGDTHVLEQWCLDFLQTYGSVLRYPDQAALNALVQRLRSDCPEAVVELPSRFNCHPRNPEATYAPIVHAFGAYKLWNDGLTAACFPEWQRDYARWLRMGGSPYNGPVDNAEYASGGAFYLLRGLFDTIARSEKALNNLQQRLTAAEAARARLETLLHRLGPDV
ncbi:MAG: glycosyl transferase family 8 [Desulfovibrio sp.]|nr:glycosyl transferase family 8 [Desulfovibrio sp.]